MNYLPKPYACSKKKVELNLSNCAIKSNITI